MWGLLAAIVFLVGITPLGLEEGPNLVLAAGIVFLLTHDFPTDRGPCCAGTDAPSSRPQHAEPLRFMHRRPAPR